MMSGQLLNSAFDCVHISLQVEKASPATVLHLIVSRTVVNAKSDYAGFLICRHQQNPLFPLTPSKTTSSIFDKSLKIPVDLVVKP